ncbi:MAG: DUF2262 domain-containing protein [Flavobacteriia bacterium]|nr:DUF2262 domain-containing protein [Flavobacteriia bacterium]
MNFYKKIKNNLIFDLNNLSESDFKFEKISGNIETTLSQELLDLLQKDGYAKNSVVGTTSSTVEIKNLTTKIKLWGNNVILNYSEEKSPLKHELPILKVKLEWINKNKVVIEKKISDSLLSLKNEVWLNEDEKILTETEFINNLKIIQLEYSEGDSISLIFSDNGMFGNHDIEINLDEFNQLNEAGI